MRDYRLPITVQNEALRIVQSAGLNPSEFRRDAIEQPARLPPNFLLTRFTHVPTGYYFVFGAALAVEVYLQVQFTPANSGGRTSYALNTRDQQMALFSEWVGTVKAEHDSVDLWAEFADQSRLIIGEVVDSADTQFTKAERELLLNRLEEIRAYLITQVGKEPRQTAFVNVTINHIAESSERLTKRDWKSVLVNGLVSLAIGLALNPPIAQELFGLATKYILPLLGTLRLPPLP